MWGDDFHKKFQILEKNFFSFYFNTINFLMILLLHKTLKRQSEHSGLCPDTSSLVYNLKTIWSFYYATIRYGCKIKNDGKGTNAMQN